MNIRKFDKLKVKVEGGYDYTPCLNAALDEIRIRGGIVEIPKGEFSIGSINRNDLSNVTVVGAGKRKTRIKKLKVRGHVFTINDCDNFVLKDMSIDCANTVFEGGVWYGGMRNSLVKNVEVMNSDNTSIVIAGEGISGGSRKAYNNQVINCKVYGQRRYHPTGKSPFIAGDGALRTIFKGCVVVDCKGDAYDSDNAPFSKFINCKAINNGERSSFCAFWSEGEQEVQNHYVTWENCYAENYSSAFGISEKVKGTILSSKAVNCQKAVSGLNNKYRILIKGFKAYECGEGIEVNETQGIFSFTNCATLEGVITQGSVAKNAFSNYSLKFNTYHPTYIESCEFDKQVYISYGDTGSRNIILKDVTLINTAIRYYHANNTRLSIENCQFINSFISGNYIKRNIIKNSIFKDSTSSLIAISDGRENHTTFENCEFNGFKSVAINAKPVGRNNKYTNIRD
ncbi:hypothetical protein [Priestia megaterium]